jgi:hypothetical protein
MGRKREREFRERVPFLCFGEKSKYWDDFSYNL